MKVLFLLIILGIIVSCDNSKRTDETVKNIDFLINEDSVTIPFFEISLDLSDAAEEELINNGESVVVIARFYSGWDNIVDIDNFPEEHRDKLGPTGLHLLNHEIELTDTRIARFENLEFPKSFYYLLTNTEDIRVNINVVSGRRSNDRNIIDVGSLHGSIRNIKGQRFTLNGGLMGERRGGSWGGYLLF